jgi:hypothetical protein
VEAFINFVIINNEKIIFISGGVICLLSAIVVWWQVFGKKAFQDQSSGIDLSQIEQMLKKILSQTHTVIGNVNTATATAGAAGAPATAAADATGAGGADFVALKAELEKRAILIEELSTQVNAAAAGAAAGDDNSMVLLARIKVLEGKLAEYEIIEDDIADLSHYKEENAKLNKEIEHLKRASPQMIDQFADALATSDAKAAEDATVTKAAPEPAVAAKVPPAAPAPAPVAAAVEAPVAAAPVAAKVAPPVVEAAEPVESATQQSEDKTEKGDIFGEYAGEASTEEDPMAALGDIDPDRMLDELKDLNADMGIGSDALLEATDFDKMSDEAINLAGKKG